ncbi:hypothetical protein BJX76DRAFT_24661 [Aspergillus varians]
MDEAREILATDEFNAPANRYLGWWHLRNIDIRQDNLSLTISALERATQSDPFDSQSWYLLGRAHMQNCFTTGSPSLIPVHSSLQCAIRGNSRCPDYWVYFGVVYYMAKGYHDSLSAISRAIILNPYFAFFWYNIAILYNAVGQDKDTMDALERALDLDDTFMEARNLMDGLQTGRGYGTGELHGPSGLALPMMVPQLLHVSETTAPREGGQDINIKPLQLDSGYGGGSYDVESSSDEDDEWEDVRDVEVSDE